MTEQESWQPAAWDIAFRPFDPDSKTKFGDWLDRQGSIVGQVLSPKERAVAINYFGDDFPSEKEVASQLGLPGRVAEIARGAIAKVWLVKQGEWSLKEGNY
tara:strand:- start:80 stop:382 length:303 start_codon:yes stop_codon:yes gene_type:complete